MKGRRLPAFALAACLLPAACSKGKEVAGDPEPPQDTAKVRTLVLVAPNGGESLVAGGAVDVRWKAEGLDTVVLEYSLDQGATWIPIARPSASDSSFAWTVPALDNPSVRIRVRGREGSPADTGDAPFAVATETKERRLTVMFPNGGGRFHRDSTLPIVWTSAGAIDSVRLEAYNGKAWEEIVRAPNAGTYAWKIAPGPVAEAKVRISTLDGMIKDESDAAFQIAAPPPATPFDYAVSGGDAGYQGGMVLLVADPAALFSDKTTESGILSKRDGAGRLLWNLDIPTFQYGSTHEVVPAGDGDVYAVGEFSGKGPDSGRTSDLWFGKVGAGGGLRWMKKEPSEGSVSGLAIRADGKGNVYVSGHFNKSARFGDTTVFVKGGYDMYVAKYSADTVFQWVQASGDRGDHTIRELDLDAAGNLWLMGRFEGKVRLGGDSIVTGTTSRHGFLAVLTPEGKAVLLRSAGDYVELVDMERDAQGSVYLLSKGRAPAFCADKIAPSASIDGNTFLSKLTPQLACLWTAPLFGKVHGFYDEGAVLHLDAEGNAWVGGTFLATRDIGAYEAVSNGGTDVFAAKYSPEGAFLTARIGGGPNHDNLYAIGTDRQGGVYLSGSFTGSTRFGKDSLASAGATDYFLVKFKETGD